MVSLGTLFGLAGPRRLPNGWAALVCLGVAALSVAILPSLPGYDAFAWIVWGHELARELLGHHGSFVLRAGPSWKPLPIMLTTLLAFIGSPVTLWMILSRALGLFGLWLAYRLGARLGEDPRWPSAGPLAGMLAALAVALTAQWVHFMYRGTSEPLTITAALFAVERHLAGRRMSAFAGGVGLALMRPEAALFVGVYGLWLLWREPGVARRVTVALGLLLIPAAWIVPPWVAIDQPLQASGHARAFHGNHGHDLTTLALHRTTHVTVLPVILAALIATALAARRRERFALALAGLALTYAGIVVVMTAHGYPGLTRFWLPAAAVVCVLAGVGVARLAALAGGGATSTLLAVGLLAAASPAFATRVRYAHEQQRATAQAVHSYHAIVGAVRRAGSARAVLPCQISNAAVNHTVQTSLAWALGVPLTRVKGVTNVARSMHGPALAFFAPRNAVVGGAPTRLLDGLHARFVTRDRMWRVLRVTRTNDPRINRCVGDGERVLVADRVRQLQTVSDRRSLRARPAFLRRLRWAAARRRAETALTEADRQRRRRRTGAGDAHRGRRRVHRRPSGARVGKPAAVRVI